MGTVSSAIRAARSDRAPALAGLLESYRNYLWLLARTSIGSDLRAKVNPSDLVQEALLKAHQRFGQFRGASEGELLVWLRRILVNYLASLARLYHGPRRDVGRERSLEQALDASSRALDRLLASQGACPKRAAERRDVKVRLADALAKLTPDHREVIVLRNLEGLEWRDVARHMKRSSAAVRVLWVRALKNLEPLIEDLR